MYDFSLDLAAEKIYHPQTKEYFKEVLSSYSNGNYRSVVVSLYTVVIADLIFKLKDLVDREDDAGAKAILLEIDKERAKDLASSKWEGKLVERVLTDTRMIELHDKANLDALKSHRNLSAHPGITQEDLLFTPNKETARAHIRNMLEGILTKPSMVTAKIVDKLIIKIPELYTQWEEVFGDSGGFERIVRKRYLQYLNERGIKKLFKTLWKFSFRLGSSDIEAEENRLANSSTLIIIHKDFPGLVHELIEGEREYFSDIQLEEGHLATMIKFFDTAPRLYKLLEKDIRTKIESKIEAPIQLFASCWFISETPEEHFEKVINKFQANNKPVIIGWRHTKKLAEATGQIDKYYDLVIKNLAKSMSYDQSYQLFGSIRLYLQFFNEAHFIQLLNVMNTCSQIYNLYDISSLVKEVQDYAKENLGYELDLAQYEKINK
ncbi:hypothetical protein NSS98_25065 [Paenibacillus sp. FSL E2-0274]|uniref:hypothetical protein n=1 Tax=Paenibacillus TaxID=44249 RepID=UPI00096E52B0|nr:hypothetical protein [Paenibacillus odorifer]OME29356.1 hypothetical protein BSK63_21645 [Paenibacillus odorifer]